MPSSSTTRWLDPSASAASVRNTAWPGSVRQIDVVNVSPGNTGEVKRAPIGGDLAGVVAAELGHQHAPGHAVGAQPVQDRLGEAGEVLGEPGIAVQRIAVTGQPIDQRLDPPWSAAPPARRARGRGSPA